MKTLIVYGSRRGSTRFCANLISKKIEGESVLYDVSDRNIKYDLTMYNRIIIGANAFNFKLNKKVGKFVKKNYKTIMKMPTHLFICSGSTKKEEVKALFRATYPDQVLDQSVSMENFGGRLDKSRESWLINQILSKMGVDEYDTLDENRIVDWTSKLGKN